MAMDDDSFKRRKQRDLEEEEEEARRKALKTGSTGKPGSSSQVSITSQGGSETDKVVELMTRAEPMIDQLDHLYMMFSSGAEKIPPNEKRKILDQTMATLQAMGKSTPSLSFRYNSLHSRYISYRDRWDKMLKDLEDGKLKRTKDFRK